MTKIYYYKSDSDSHRDLTMGFSWIARECPTLLEQLKGDDITLTHVLLEETDKEDLEEIFTWYQARNWSPNGEARELIKSKGLRHTSLHVGDIVEFDDGTRYICDNVGWNKL